MRTIKIWNDNPADNQLSEIIDAIKDGELVIIPTDSVYGIACDALNVKAVNKLCKLKGINPDKHHLSIICSNISMAAEYTRIGNEEFDLLKTYTPGTFTFILPANHQLPKAFKGRKVAGVRIPDCSTARHIAERLGHPLLSTSIEFEDSDHAREPELIAERYENSGIELMVDAGEGKDEFTTIIDCTGSANNILRQGIGVL